VGKGQGRRHAREGLRTRAAAAPPWNARITPHPSSHVSARVLPRRACPSAHPLLCRWSHAQVYAEVSLVFPLIVSQTFVKHFEHTPEPVAPTVALREEAGGEH
jgi:hypothetical protein